MGGTRPSQLVEGLQMDPRFIVLITFCFLYAVACIVKEEQPEDDKEIVGTVYIGYYCAYVIVNSDSKEAARNTAGYHHWWQ